MQIELTILQVQFIARCLAKMPYEESAELLNYLGNSMAAHNQQVAAEEANRSAELDALRKEVAEFRKGPSA